MNPTLYVFLHHLMVTLSHTGIALVLQGFDKNGMWYFRLGFNSAAKH
jgi:hypothetical protein